MPRASTARILLLLALVLAGLTLAVALWPHGGQQADVMPMDIEWSGEIGFATLADGRLVRLRLVGDRIETDTLADGLAFPRGLAIGFDEIYVAELGPLPCENPIPRCKGEHVGPTVIEGERALLESAAGRVLAYPLTEDGVGEPRVVLDGIPFVNTDHGLNDIDLGPDGLLYLSIGNLDRLAWDDVTDAPEVEGLGTIVQIDAANGVAAMYASGFRNVYGLDFDEADVLWGVDNDGRGRGPWRFEELERIEEGLDFGFPDDGTVGPYTRRTAFATWILPSGAGSGGLQVSDGTVISGGCGSVTRLRLEPDGGDADLRTVDHRGLRDRDRAAARRTAAARHGARRGRVHRDHRSRALRQLMNKRWLWAALAALVYGVLIGGTGLGEQHSWLRVVNGLVAGSAIVAYLVLAPRRADAIDAACLGALLVFLIGAVASSYPRQSLDSALGALTWTATFFLARVLLARPDARVAVVRVLIGLSVVLTLVAAARWLPPTVEWWTITGVTPPLDMNRSGVLWGHRHDLALVVAVLYPAWWIGRRSPIRTAAAIVFGVLAALVVLVDGSRTLWLALVVAGLAVAAPAALRALAPEPKGARDRRRRGCAGRGGRRRVGRDPGGGGSAADDEHAREPRRHVGRAARGVGPAADRGRRAGVVPVAAPGHRLLRRELLGAASPGQPAVPAPAGGRGARRDRRRDRRGGAGAGSLARRMGAALRARRAGGGRHRCEPDRVRLPHARRDRLGRAGGTEHATETQTPRRWTRVASLAMLGIIGLAFASTAVAAFFHDGARRSIAEVDLSTATGQLETAGALDPGMALYPRLLGAVKFLEGDHGAAETALSRATELNPNDDLAWRTLAVVRSEAGDIDGADEAIGRAVELHRADPTNLLLRLTFERLRSDTEALATAGEVVHAWPWIVGLPEWAPFAGLPTTDALDAATARALDRATAPQQSNSLHVVWIAALAGDEELLAEAIETTGLTRTLGEGYAAAVVCDPSVPAYLEDAPDVDRRFDEYWALRVRQGGVAFSPDEDAERAWEIMTGLSLDETLEPLNPLDENGFGGLSTDTWGYRRPPATWPDLVDLLPSPDAAYRLWMLDPIASALTAELEAQEACR